MIRKWLITLWAYFGPAFIFLWLLFIFTYLFQRSLHWLVEFSLR